MKKALSIISLVILILIISTGCSKKDAVEELELGSVNQQSLEEAVESSNEDNINQSSNVISYILYLKMKDKPFLYDEMFSVDINSEEMKDKSIEEFVVEQLLNYKSDENFSNIIPKGTKLLGIKREGNNVIVNFSKEFLEKKLSSSEASLVIGSIVNSLIAIPGNETVQFTVEGEVLKNFNGSDISKPLSFLEGLFPDK